MKINKAKLLVGTLAIASVAATVGSISGTVAWFQYNTRASVSYQGATAHCSESLEIRIRTANTTRDVWKTELVPADINAYLTAAKDGTTYGAGRSDATSVRPVTSGVLAANAFPAADSKNNTEPKLFRNPIYQYFTYNTWTAATIEDYVLIPLQLRVRDVDGGSSDTLLNKNIYISDIHLDGSVTTSKTDVTSALRMSVRSYPSGATAGENVTFARTYSTTGADVDVFGKLDLNNDNELDGNDTYSWDTKSPVNYGGDSGVAASTEIKAANLANDADAYDIKDATASGVTAIIGETTASDQVINVDLLIYLEGWTIFDLPLAEVANESAITNPVDGGLYKIGSDYKKYVAGTSTYVDAPAPTALWDAKNTIGANFNAGIRFSTDAHDSGAE